jgi:hypothetical protein
MNRFVRKNQYIGQLEILAAVAVYYSEPSLFRNRDVIHWIDNTSALMALIKGYSGMSDSARLVHALYLVKYHLKCRVWFEHVVSEANVADLPSRGEFEYLVGELKSETVECVIPPFEAWDEPFSTVTWERLEAPRKRPRS